MTETRLERFQTRSSIKDAQALEAKHVQGILGLVLVIRKDGIQVQGLLKKKENQGKVATSSAPAEMEL